MGKSVARGLSVTPSQYPHQSNRNMIFHTEVHQSVPTKNNFTLPVRDLCGGVGGRPTSNQNIGSNVNMKKALLLTR